MSNRFARDRPAGVLPASLAQLHADPWTAPFWEATARHELVCARCVGCGVFRMPPTPFCHACRRQDISWDECEGRGTVYSYTVIRHAVIDELREHVPYIIALVDLTDAPGVRLVVNLLGMDPDQATIGMAVDIVWDDVREGVTIPRVVPAATG